MKTGKSLWISIATALGAMAITLGAQSPATPKATLEPTTRLRLTGDVDSNSPAVWDLVAGVPRLFVTTSFNGRPSTEAGSTLTRLGLPYLGSLDPWPGGGVWMEAIVPDVDGTWYGYYHNEIPADSVCPRHRQGHPAHRRGALARPRTHLGGSRHRARSAGGRLYVPDLERLLRQRRRRLQRAARSRLRATSTSSSRSTNAPRRSRGSPSDAWPGRTATIRWDA